MLCILVLQATINFLLKRLIPITTKLYPFLNKSNQTREQTKYEQSENNTPSKNACTCFWHVSAKKTKIWHSTTKHLYTKTLRLSAVCIHSSKISYIPRHPKNPINPSLHLSLRLLQYCFHQDKIITNSKPHS